MMARYKPWLCRSCGYLADAASAVQGGDDLQPATGDFAMCLNCGALSTFDGTGWRPTIERDLQHLDAETLRRIDHAQRLHARAKVEGVIGDLAKRGGRA